MKLFVGAKGLVEYNGKILLLQESARYLDGSEVGKWDVPGGRIDPEETTKDGLIREIREESGLEIAEIGEVLGVYDGFPMIRGEKCHVVRAYFLCTAVNDAVVLSNDHDEYAWVDPDEIGERVLMDDIHEVIERYRAMR